MRVLAHEWLCIVFNTWWAQLWGVPLMLQKKLIFCKILIRDLNKKMADDFLFFAPHGSSYINLLGAVDEFRKHT